ncbi:Superoxide dismutase [Cu-Zn] precursor [Polystyrenella longa]|uniref:Superoxide dismutase [Cu-Zn] n=1 Tax=Polystyrenella longa TaxID=2528007 RepID=A0A518CPQ1_9PLAN|nr:superoxide dismutase family protein [Polystyrenella longa]QDU81193.1 Superoxide dismutase [Cu-Zn] precursor [Polystyrenella longa]
MNKLNLLTSLPIVFSLLFCNSNLQSEDHEAHSSSEKVPKKAVAVLFPTQGNDVTGVITLEQKEDGVLLKGKVINLTPGKHGFHIHEYGDLRSKDGKSAGGHYSPEGHRHGSPDDKEHHAGDFGNIDANDEGTATIEVTAKDQKLHMLLGRAIVVHGGADDLKSQPSGNAGPRVSLGVIGLANSE